LTREDGNSSFNAMRKRLTRAFVIAMATPPALAAASAGLLAQSPAPVARAGLDSAIELASFDSAWRRVRDTYYDPQMRGIDWNRMRDRYRPLVARATSRDQVRAAISAMLSELGDSHFGVLASEQVVASDETAATEVSPGDVGMDVRFLGGDLVVSRLDSGGPAISAGVRLGWSVVEIDSVAVASQLHSIRTAQTDRERRRAAARVLIGLKQRLLGGHGAPVRVVFRDHGGRPVERRLVRRATHGTLVRLGDLPPMLTWLEHRVLGDPARCTGVIRFNTWMTPVSQAFENALNAMRRCDGVVLDLRGNIGGVAAMIMGIAGHFTDRQLVLGVLRMRGSELRYVANPRRVIHGGVAVEPYGGQLALLVDELSASTTEIFAAALQHYSRARVFGDTTAGQALPSLVTRLPNGDALLYAVADLTDPAGRRLEGVGIIPDERVPLTRDALLDGRDEVLAAALRWIAGGPRRAAPRGSNF
jgi:carboxyl-terminal processing protease